MVYKDMPIIIPLLATGYLFTVYLLLMLAQWTMKKSRYAANSMSDAYAHSASEDALKQKQAQRWSFQVTDTVLLTTSERQQEKANVVSATSSTDLTRLR